MDGNRRNDSLKWNWTSDVEITFFCWICFPTLSQNLPKPLKNRRIWRFSRTAPFWLVICKLKVHWVAIPAAWCSQNQSAAALFGAVVCHMTTAIGSFLVNPRISYILFLYFPFFLPQPVTGATVYFFLSEIIVWLLSEPSEVMILSTLEFIT